MADEPRRKTRQRATSGPTTAPAGEPGEPVLAAPSPAPAPASDEAASAPVSQTGAPPPRRVTGRPRRAKSRESTILGLAERARQQHTDEQRPILPLPDPFFVILPELRQSLLNKPLDTSLRELAEGVATAVAPAVVQVWIADPAPWANEQARIGGQELIPMLRPRAMGRAVTRAYADSGADAEAADPTAACELPRLPMRPDPLVEEVVATRRPVLLFAADDHPLAVEWRLLVPAAPSHTSEAADETRIGTLAAYPLRARGQFLGVLLIGAATRLPARHLASLEELADLCALAADRDRLLSYSRGQEALAQTVVRYAPVAVAALTGPDHIFALANPTFSLLLGVSDESRLIGRPLGDVAPDRAASLAASLRLDAVYEGGEPQAMIELPIHTFDRGMTYWNVTSTPLPGISTSIGGVLVAAVDVSRQVLARQRAQEAAEVAQERIGQMMTLHATSLAVASQLGADPRELLADILRRSIALLEARAGVIYVRDPRRGDLEVIVCQGLRGAYIGNRIRVGEGLAGRVAATGQGTILDDYRTLPFQPGIYSDEDLGAVIAVPLIAHGQVVGVLDVLDDASRRAFTDDDLWLLELFAAQAAQAIENARTYVQLEHAYRKQRELDRMKDDFIATASHELRTPLTGVQGFLDLLLDYPGSRDEETALDFLNRASDSAQELAEISERLLQTSRLDTGRIELHLGPVRLSTVIEAALRPFRELQQARGVTHELAMRAPGDVYVRADLGRLKEVLDNLVSNAIKYSPQGGRVTVECVATARAAVERAEPGDPRTIEERPTLVMPPILADELDPEYDPSTPAPALLEAMRDAPYYVVAVRDEGIGIPDEERSRLFGRFSRLDSARVNQIRGTGLGLYICRQMMRAMGGDVWLQESAPERGSVFALALPAFVAPLGDPGDSSAQIEAVSVPTSRYPASER